ncbi:hypothetical protein AW863_RS17780, partial [Acinetobacter baumannii]|nr:hypothetical protein [Acinetobacter baumannii]EHU1883953.1 hypothetical protein [Acinetobacter baumannii]EHU2830461.1 hypothetical protein [Acinetobacter baumannii]EHU2917326.1 hypothetical protein [Acinetobacter baumannii]EHU2921422.1 hypothetical protein [Acinetobacter baumannii]
MDNEYAKFFFNRKVDVYQLECIELSHPSFMNTYRIVRNDDRGVYVQHKEGSGQVYYEFLPASIQRSGMLGDLDQTLTVSISGLGDVMPDEFERVIEGQYPDVKPT